MRAGLHWATWTVVEVTDDTLRGEVLAAEGDEDRPDIILPYALVGNMVSLEMVDASRWVARPTQIRCELAGHTA
jgi:hypothetical protein